MLYFASHLVFNTVKCLSEVYGFVEQQPGELSRIARYVPSDELSHRLMIHTLYSQGSGSASRSLEGGFVKWIKGEQADGSDSFAVQVVNEQHWPEMRVLIFVANGGQKEIGSTDGMQLTVETSPLLKYRCEEVVPKRMADIELAIQRKDFETFANITMADSNQFHAVCLDTLPPIFYLNQTSKAIIDLCNAWNKSNGISVAYTYDAGPNAVIYTLESTMDAFLHFALSYFAADGKDFSKSVFHHALFPLILPLGLFVACRLINDPLHLSKYSSLPSADALPALESTTKLIEKSGRRTEDERIYSVIVSRVGRGAEIKKRAHSFK